MMTGNIPRWFTLPQTVTHPSTNPAVHGRESNSQPVDHESDVLTITPPSQLWGVNSYRNPYASEKWLFQQPAVLSMILILYYSSAFILTPVPYRCLCELFIIGAFTVTHRSTNTCNSVAIRNWSKLWNTLNFLQKYSTITGNVVRNCLCQNVISSLSLFAL